MGIEPWQDKRARRQAVVSQAAIAPLTSLSQSIDALAQVIFARRVQFTELAGADMMALSYVTKLREHMRSVRVLVGTGLHRDALLIARSMFEATGRLMWAFRAVPERPDRWLWFGLILDWRTIAKNDAAGRHIADEDRHLLSEKLAEHGPTYYTEEVRKGLKNAADNPDAFQMPADPYDRDWTQVSLYKMFKELDSVAAYDWIYRESSEWAHSGPRAVFRAMEHVEWGVAGFTQEDGRAAAIALQIACQSLLYCLTVLVEHFGLEYRDNIARLERQLSDALDGAVKAADGARDPE